MDGGIYPGTIISGDRAGTVSKRCM